MTDRDPLSHKAHRLLAQLALQLAQDDVDADGLDDQLNRLTTAQQAEYLAPGEETYATEILLAVLDTQQARLLEHRDSPADWLGWQQPASVVARVFGARS